MMRNRRSVIVALLACALLALAVLSSARAQSPACDPATMTPGTWCEVPNSRLDAVAATPPAGCPNGFCGYLKGIMTGWSGGAFDVARDELLVCGGGHNSYAGNECYGFSLATMQWSRKSEPSSLVGWTDGDVLLSDQSPVALHTYACLHHLPAPIDQLFVWAGAKYKNTAGPTYPWLGPTPWLRVNMTLAQATACAWDPVSQRIYGVGFSTPAPANTLNNRAFRLDPVAGTLEPATLQVGMFWPAQAICATDVVRRKMTCLGTGTNPGGKKVVVFNLATWTGVPVQQVTTGDTSLSDAISGPAACCTPGFVHHAPSGKYLAWHGGTDLWVLDPETWIWVRLPPDPSNTVVPTAGVQAGTFGRFQHIPSRDSLIAVNAVDQNVFIHRLRDPLLASAPPIPPPAPSAGRLALAYTGSWRTLLGSLSAKERVEYTAHGADIVVPCRATPYEDWIYIRTNGRVRLQGLQCPDGRRPTFTWPSSGTSLVTLDAPQAKVYSASNPGRLEVRDLVLSARNKGGNCIDVNRGQQLDVENVTAEWCRMGILTATIDDLCVKVKNSEMRYTEEHGIYLSVIQCAEIDGLYAHSSSDWHPFKSVARKLVMRNTTLSTTDQPNNLDPLKNNYLSAALFNISACGDSLLENVTLIRHAWKGNPYVAQAVARQSINGCDIRKVFAADGQMLPGFDPARGGLQRFGWFQIAKTDRVLKDAMDQPIPDPRFQDPAYWARVRAAGLIDPANPHLFRHYWDITIENHDARPVRTGIGIFNQGVAPVHSIERPAGSRPGGKADDWLLPLPPGYVNRSVIYLRARVSSDPLKALTLSRHDGVSAAAIVDVGPTLPAWWPTTLDGMRSTP